MKRSLVTFLQIVIVLVGIGTLMLLLWEPHLEGRNAQASLFEIYFTDPFLAYAYVASIPLFVALYKSFNVLGLAKQYKVYSKAALKSLQIVKYCGLALIGFVVLGELIILFSPSDDRAGGVFMGFLVASGSAVIALAALRFERMVQRGIR